MSKTKFWIIVSAYNAAFVLPMLAYLVVNFYVYLFDGWKLEEKFGIALIAAFCTAMVNFGLGMWYSERNRYWK